MFLGVPFHRERLHPFSVHHSHHHAASPATRSRRSGSANRTRRPRILYRLPGHHQTICRIGSTHSNVPSPVLISSVLSYLLLT